MNRDDKLKRLEYMKNKHQKQHAIVEALEGEKAPEESIAHAKRIKLSIKDEISALETALKAEDI